MKIIVLLKKNLATSCSFFTLKLITEAGVLKPMKIDQLALELFTTGTSLLL